MGSSASPIIADIVMEELLESSLKFCDIRPKLLTKYVDDLFGIVKRSAINDILTKFNSFNQHIQFTLEKEDNGQLPYLDILLIRNEDKIMTNWYQKPTASGRLVNYNSMHPKKIIYNTANNFIKRVLSISDVQFHRENIQKIKRILQQNSFPLRTVDNLIDNAMKIKSTSRETNIDKNPEIFKSVVYVSKLSERFEKSGCMDKQKYKIAHKSNNTLRRLFTHLKSKTDNMDKSNLIYKIPCNGNGATRCEKVYIGTTKNKLKSRISGHRSDIKLRHTKTLQKTALATHCAKNNHDANLERVSVLQCESHYSKRLTLEMLHIQQTPLTQRMNYKTDMDNLSQSYKLLMAKRI